eukprot:301757_1
MSFPSSDPVVPDPVVPVFSKYIDTYNACLKGIVGQMDRTNAEVTIQTATAKLKWMHCLQKNGYVKYDELKSIGLEFGIDLYYIEEIILRDLPVVIITACEYSKLDRGTKQKWVLLTSFPDDLTSLQMKKYIEFICQLMYKHDKEMLQLRMAVGELMDRLYHKSRSLKQHVIANEVKSIIWEMFDPQIREKVFIPCVELEKFWKQNKLSLYEFEKIRIGAQQIEYRMPVWKYVNWSDTNKEKITNLVLRLPSKREWIERWLTNKILGKLVVGDFKRFKDTEIAKYIADHEETIVDNGGLIFNRQKLNQYGDDKQEIPKLVRVLSKKIGINEQDIYDEMRRYLEEEYDETDFTDDEEDFEVIVEQKAIYALTPFDTNIVLNRE